MTGDDNVLSAIESSVRAHNGGFALVNAARIGSGGNNVRQNSGARTRAEAGDVGPGAERGWNSNVVQQRPIAHVPDFQDR